MGVDMLLLDSHKVKFTFKKTMVKDKKQSSNALGVANVPITEASIHCGYAIR
ncbi:hypothetical protein Bca101_090844 [Brassica carinata]